MPHYNGDVYARGVLLGPSNMMFSTGKQYFVDPAYGNDGNPGTIDKPFATITQAEGMCVSGKGDTVFLMSHGTTTANVTSYLTETLVWDKDKTHLVGLAAPSEISPRARIAASTTQTTAIDPLLQVTADGCIFANFQVFNGIDAAVAANGIEVTGARNYFFGVHIAGIGNAKNDLANAYSLKLNGADENLFERCTIGIDTIAKGTQANSELMVASAAERNVFKDCTFKTDAEAAGHQFVLAGASAIERDLVFIRCLFHNPAANTAITQMDEVFEVSATQNGSIILKDCTMLGADDWDDADTGIVFIDGAAPTTGTSGIAITTTA